MERVRSLNEAKVDHRSFSTHSYKKYSASTRASDEGIYRAAGKRLIDIVLVLAGSLFVLPVAIVIAIMIKRDGGPIFYSQPRLGRNGKEFRFWKFRSMVVDADEALEAHLAGCSDARREWHVAQKLRNDPRITQVGRFIRKTSLDELPQLWNVLRGDMSLVGPRPMMPDQRELYPGNDYESLRPGITGFWQVSDRNEVSFAERAIFDTRYARELSLKADLRTLFQTIGVVFKGSGC